MSCVAALIKKNVTARPDQTVGEVIQAMRKAAQGFVAILEKDKTLVGYFTYRMLLEDTMPVSLSMGSGDGAMNISLPGAPGLGKRLQRNMAVPVSALMQRAAHVVFAEASLDSAAQALQAAGGTVAVVEQRSNIFLGIITEESLIAALEKTQEMI